MQLTRWIRKYERTILVVLTVLLATSFGAGYGVPSAVGQFLSRLFGRTSPAGPEGVARIFGRPVSAEDFRAFYIRWARFPFGVEKEEQAWNVYASVALAQELGVRVSDEEMLAFVENQRSFFDNPTSPTGKYSYASFRAALDRSRMTQEEFEVTLREFLSVFKLRDWLTSSVVVTSAEVWPLYREERMSYDVAAVRLPADTFLAQVPEPSAEEVTTFYEAEKGRRYLEPERIRVEVLAAPYSGFLADVAPSEEEARQYYDAHPQEFALPEEPSEGETPGQQRPPQVKPFADVRESILERLRRERAKTEAQGALQEAQRKLAADAQATPSSIADASSGRLQTATSEFFSSAEVGKVPLLGASFGPGDAFLASLFTGKGEAESAWGEVAPGKEAAVLCRVLGRQPSRLLPLDEVREKVVADVKHVRAMERAAQEASTLAEELKKEKQPLDSPVVHERGLELETPPRFTVNDVNAPPYAASLRGAEPGAVVSAPGDDAAYVVEVRDTHAPTWEEFQSGRREEKAFLEGLYRNWIMRAQWSELVRRETGLEVFPKKGAPEATEETPTGEGGEEAPPTPQTNPGEPHQPAAPAPEGKPGESSPPPAPSSPGSTSPVTP